MTFENIFRIDQILGGIEILLFIESIVGQIAVITRVGSAAASWSHTGGMLWIVGAPLLSTILAVGIMALREQMKCAYIAKVVREQGFDAENDEGK